MNILSKKLILVTNGTNFIGKPLCKTWEAEALKAEKYGIRTVLLRIGIAFRAIFGDIASEIMLEGQRVLPQKALESGCTFLYLNLPLSLEKIENHE